MPTVGLDSCCQMSALPMLVENAPQTDYMVETKITLNVPEGTGFNYAQGDLFLYGDDRNFLRLDLFASAGTRQIEFVKQTSATPAYAADTGYSNLSEPALQNGVTSAYLRIVKRTVNDEANYTAYSSQDGVEWHRGATWKHSLTNEKIASPRATSQGSARASITCTCTRYSRSLASATALTYRMRVRSEAVSRVSRGTVSAATT